MAGIYIAVQNGVGGSISVSVDDGMGAGWETSSSTPNGYTGFSHDATFTATSDSGYAFSYFSVRVYTGSEVYGSGSWYSTANKYTNPCTIASDYVDSGDCYIVYAVFEEDASTSTKSFSVVSMGTWSTSTTSKSTSIGEYEILRYAYTPTIDGTLTFSSSTTGVDTIGWIYNSTTCTVDAYGYPSYYIGSYTDDASGSAFSATAELSANTTYYLYVCCYNGNSASVTLTANFSGYGYTVTNMGTWSASVTAKSATIDGYEVLRYAYTPSISGTLTFYADTTSVDTVGWINDSTASSVNTNGRPASSSYYVGSYTDDANSSAFSASTEVVSGVTYYLFVCCYGGGNGTVSLNVTVTKPRPSDWSWVTTVSQGSTIKLTAAEWNSFTSRINEFREYAELSEYSFTTAVSGVTPIEATICNEAHTAIDAITGHGTLPTRLVLNGSLYASFFNGLKDALNAIP